MLSNATVRSVATKPARVPAAVVVPKPKTGKVVASASKRDNNNDIAARIVPAVLAAVIGLSPVGVVPPALAGSPAGQAIETLGSKKGDAPTPAQQGGLKATALKALQDRTGSTPESTGTTITADNVSGKAKEALGGSKSILGGAGDALSNLNEKAKGALSNVSGGASDLGDQARDQARGAADSAKGGASTLGDKLRRAADSVKGSASSAGDQLRSTADQAKDSASSTASSAKDNLRQASASQGATSGVGSRLKSAVESVKDSLPTVDTRQRNVSFTTDNTTAAQRATADARDAKPLINSPSTPFGSGKSPKDTPTRPADAASGTPAATFTKGSSGSTEVNKTSFSGPNNATSGNPKSTTPVNSGSETSRPFYESPAEDGPQRSLGKSPAADGPLKTLEARTIDNSAAGTTQTSATSKQDIPLTVLKEDLKKVDAAMDKQATGGVRQAVQEVKEVVEDQAKEAQAAVESGRRLSDGKAQGLQANLAQLKSMLGL